MSPIDGPPGGGRRTDTREREIAARQSRRRPRMLAAVLVLLVSIAVYLVFKGEVFEDVRRLSTAVLLTAFLCQFPAQLLWNAAMLVPLRTRMERLGFWELFMVRSGGLVAGYLLPTAGNLAVRATYLTRRGLTYPDFAWATLTTNLLALCAAAALAACSVGLLWYLTGAAPGAVVGLTAGILGLAAAGMAALWLLPRLSVHRELARWRWLWMAGRALADPGTMGRVFGFSLARHVLNFVTFGLLYRSLSPTPGGFVAGGLVYAISSPVRMVAITPGNFGVNEWVVAVVGKLLAFDVTTGLLVALIFRGVSILAQTLGVLIAAALLATQSGIVSRSGAAGGSA